MGVPIDTQTLWKFDNLDRRLRALDAQVAKVVAHGGDYSEKTASELKVEAAQKLYDAAVGFLTAANLDVDAPKLSTTATNSDLAVLTAQLSAGLAAYRDQHVEKRHGHVFWLIEDKPGEVEYVPVSTADTVPTE
jgi:hypothetical protein